MPKCAVVNASPLIFLSKAGLIHFLQQAAPDIVIPETVAWEIGRRGEKDRTAQTVANTPWLTRVETPLIPPLIQSWDLGPGESAVLAYAVVHPGVVAIIDDGAGRRCAETLGIPLLGTLGLVMIAKKRGLIAVARPVIALLKQHGMFLSESTIDRAMRLIDE
jgi:predicted nucleic acid-binding protein